MLLEIFILILSALQVVAIEVVVGAILTVVVELVIIAVIAVLVVFFETF
jgi:hypothetical protein